MGEGGEFRPSAAADEHSPRRECQDYQLSRGLLGGEAPYGEGRALEVSFVCYSPPGSGAAHQAAGEIRDALETLREVAAWPAGKRSWFGLRHGWGCGQIAGRGGPAYRPPAKLLPRRPGPPKPPPAPGFGAMVDARLESWGRKDLADERRAARGREAGERR